jgi:hypothetical protein
MNAPVTNTIDKPVSRRGRKAGVPAQVRPDIPSDDFTINIPNADTRATFKRRREERKPQQLATDAMVAEVYKDWVKAGKPSNWVDMPSRVWVVSSAKVSDDAQFMLRKAATFYGRRLFSGQIDDKPSKCKDPNCRCQDKPNGLFHIPFCVMDAREKRKSSMTIEQFMEFGEDMGISIEDIIQWVS